MNNQAKMWLERLHHPSAVKERPRPDLEAVVAERLKDYPMSPELIVAFSRMLSEWELHWWEAGQKSAVSKMREALGL